ncbi:MAG: hypothetical protein WCD18_18245 [Thermosynechococcaceae cyanobacterium]
MVLYASQNVEWLGLLQRSMPETPVLQTLLRNTASSPENPLSLGNGIASALSAKAPVKFAVFAGGGSPKSNEIALEKNVRYFQRTLGAFGLSSTASSLFFANGIDGRATVRYIDPKGKERFKKSDIPNLIGASTPRNLRQWVMTASHKEDRRPVFFYFTGHGIFNKTNPDNNAMLMWGDSEVSVRGFTQLLDHFPQEVPIALMMAQCYSGGFANVIYEQGNPANSVSKKSRCGFFATVKTRPSLGCTPEVDEADYQDYSSSFFAGLSGVDRLGQKVGSADYNKDSKVSYIEAHAFAKVDDAAADWPVSTSEEWLQRQISDRQRQEILNQPIQKILQQGRPEQQYVVQALAEKIQIDINQSAQQFEILTQIPTPEEFDVTQAYGMRLRMELLNIGAEARVRASGNREAIAVLAQLLKCEFSAWI